MEDGTIIIINQSGKGTKKATVLITFLFPKFWYLNKGEHYNNY